MKPLPLASLFLAGLLLESGGRSAGAADPLPPRPEPATDLQIQTWGIEEGLPQSSVTTLAQTPDGYLWFGTFNGLVRFDGVRFTVFGQLASAALPGNQFVNLQADAAGRLWIKSTRNDVISLLEKGRFKSLGAADGVVPGPGFSFVDLPNGDLLLARTNSSVRKWDGVKFVEAPELGNLPRIKSPQLMRDASGTFYGRGFTVLTWFDGTNWLHVPPPDGAVEPGAQAMTPARAGGVWVTAGKRVARLEKGVWVESLGEIPWPRQRIRAYTMLEDSTGTLWIGTYGDGLYRRSGQRWNVVEGLPAPVIRALLEDHEGSLWVGTEGGGLSRLKPKLFTNYSKPDGLPENIITAVREVQPGEMWVGTHGGGLAVLKENRFTPIKFPEQTNHRWIWALTVDRAGTVWAGTYGPKLFSFPNGQYTELAMPNGDAPEAVTAIVEDRHGALWVGTRKGLLCYTNGHPREFTTRDGLADNAVCALLETPDGVLWIGTDRGLNRYEHQRFTTFGHPEQLTAIRSLYVDRGDLWVGMGDRKGLARIRDGQVVVFRPSDGLPLDSLQSTVADDLGNLWVAGSRGLCRMVLAELDAFAAGKRKTIEGFLYGRDDGLGSKELPGGHQPNVWKDAQGRLWFGTMGGLSVIDPKQVKPNAIPPPVWIEAVLGFAQPPLAEAATTLPAHIAVPAGTKEIQIHYTALSFLAPGQILFKYRLEGFDPDWTPVGNRRVAYYQGLAPGDYRFEVTACNNHGVWNPTGASLALTVLPFFWQTRWFQGAVALALVASLLTAYHRRVSRLKQERQAHKEFSQRLLFSQEQERKRLAGEIHDGLGQNLLIIKNRAVAARTESDPAAVSEQLAEIELSATEAIAEVRTMAHNLRPYQLDRLGLTLALQAIVKHFHSPALNIAAEIAPVDKRLPAEHEIHFYRIIQESLNNVVKHSGARHVWLTVRSEAARLVVDLRDDGRGFDYPAMIADPASKRGLGLTGLVERAHSMDGELEIDSLPGRGTRLRLTVPAKPPAKTS